MRRLSQTCMLRMHFPAQQQTGLEYLGSCCLAVPEDHWFQRKSPAENAFTTDNKVRTSSGRRSKSTAQGSAATSTYCERDSKVALGTHTRTLPSGLSLTPTLSTVSTSGRCTVQSSIKVLATP